MRSEGQLSDCERAAELCNSYQSSTEGTPPCAAETNEVWCGRVAESDRMCGFCL